MSDSEKRRFMAMHREQLDSMCAQQDSGESEWKHTELEMRALAESAQLRADLARVTAERDFHKRAQDNLLETKADLQTELAETRKALDAKTVLLFNAEDSERTLRAELAQCQRDLAACAESRAKAEARVKAIQVASDDYVTFDPYADDNVDRDDNTRSFADAVMEALRNG